MHCEVLWVDEVVGHNDIHSVLSGFESRKMKILSQKTVDHNPYVSSSLKTCQQSHFCHVEEIFFVFSHSRCRRVVMAGVIETVVPSNNHFVKELKLAFGLSNNQRR